MHGIPDRFALLAVGSLVFATACDSSGGIASTTSATLLSVIPSSFSGDTVCGNFQGAWRTYVATLTDVTNPDEPFVLASSVPVDCAMPVSFSWVVPGHSYTAQVDGYDRADLVPYGGENSGSRRMLDPETQTEVPPRWISTCGISDDDNPQSVATICLAYNNMIVRDCTVFKQVTPSDGDTSLELDSSLVRGVLQCGNEAHQIDKLQITPLNPDLQPSTIACDERVTYDKLVPNVTYQFRVEAYESGSEQPTWATQCRGTAKEGIKLPISCDPLTDRGALRVDMKKELSNIERSCGEDDIVNYRLSLLGSTPARFTKGCAFPTILTNLTAGAYELQVQGFDRDATVKVQGECKGVVQIGQLSEVSCELTAVSD